MVAQADLTTVEMMEGARIAGRLVEAATRREVAVRPVAEVAVRVLADQAADGQTITEMGTVEDLPLAALAVPEAEGAQGAPETEGALADREEEEVPLMGVTTTGGEEAAFTPTSRRS